MTTWSTGGGVGIGPIAVLALGLAGPLPGLAAEADKLDGVVQVDATVPPDARTAAALGTHREGTGVVIDDDGLILTIGYLILEAAEVTIRGVGPAPVPAQIVAYDAESGFGILRATERLGVTPIPLGSSEGLRPMQPLLVASRVGELDATGVYLVDRRDFAGYWEYLLEDAIFTAPAHGQFGGAALLDEGRRLVGIGSLFVGDAGTRGGRQIAGNMFVPIEQLGPIMADLLRHGRRQAPARPWLGLFAEEHKGRVFVTRVTPDGPAEAAGVTANDLILGVGGQPVDGLADFYRKLWTQGDAGVQVPLNLLRGMGTATIKVRSADRYRHLRLNPSF
jgi:S1-C subfamily serine protease